MFQIQLTGFPCASVQSVDAARSLVAKFPGFTIGREVNGVAMIYAAGREVGQIRDQAVGEPQDVMLGSIDLAEPTDQAGDAQRVQAKEPTYTVRDADSGQVKCTRRSGREARSFAESYCRFGSERLEICAEDSTVILTGLAPAEFQPRPQAVQEEEEAAADRRRRHDGATGPQADKADALTLELDAIGVQVQYEPRARIEGDDAGESAGHMFSASVAIDAEELSTVWVWLDDREPASFRQQIAAGLREVAEGLLSKAAAVDPEGTSGRAAA